MKSPPPETTATNRIAAIDGLRGLAILFVIADHGSTYTTARGNFWSTSGLLGVDIFFVVSGYIITRRLLSERSRTGNIAMRFFYLRRAFRILPLVLAYLFVYCIVAHKVHLADFSYKEVLASLFFFRNYMEALHPRAGVYTSHFWSLSVEEHFYLLWPTVFFFTKNRKALIVAAIGIVICASYRLYQYLHYDYTVLHFKLMRTGFVFDGLLAGCVLAILLTYPTVTSFIFRNFPKELPLFCALLIFFNSLRSNAEPTLTTYLLIAIAMATILIVDEGLARKWLSSRPLVWVGTISYSLYVWQQLFLEKPAANILPLGRFSVFPLNLICAFLAATCSYYLLELPMIRLGKRLETSRRSHSVVRM